MKTLVTIFVLLSFSQASFAASIKCQQSTLDYDTGGDKIISQMIIELGDDGQPISLKLDRIADENFGEVHILLDKSNAKLSRRIEAGNVEDKDEETGELYYSWGIDKIEKIRAVGKEVSVRLDINDHNYSGTPGSTIFITQNGNEIALPGGGEAMTMCDGPFLK